MTTSIKTSLSAIALSLALAALPLIWLDTVFQSYQRAWTHGTASIAMQGGRDSNFERNL